MSYIEYLKDVLRPLHIYDLDNGYGADEIFVLGTALDDIFDALETTLREMSPLTAEGLGLESYKNILPDENMFESIEDRRAAIAALSTVSGFSLADLNSNLSRSGINATVSEYGQETVCVSISAEGHSDDYVEAIKQCIEQLVPCHLSIVYEVE